MAFKYRGILAKPQKYDPVPGLLASDDAREAWIERQTAESLKRWRELFAAHKVEWGDESKLLWRLAKAHVPGFTMQTRPGPKTTWDELTKAEFRIAVDEYISERNTKGYETSIAQACGHFVSREPWKDKLRQRGRSPKEALRGHYNTADPRWVKMVLDAQAYQRLTDVKTLGDLTKLARNSRQVTSRSNKTR
jgi:hypothetical protein